MGLQNLSHRDREKVLTRNAKQSADNAEGKKRHDRTVDKFYDQIAEKMEPMVHAQLRREGQVRKFF